MPTYAIEIDAKKLTLKHASSIAEYLGKMFHATATIRPVNQPKTRQERLSVAIGKIEAGMGDLEDLSAELTDRLDAAPSGRKAETLRESIAQLDAAVSDANRAVEQAQDVTFPK